MNRFLPKICVAICWLGSLMPSLSWASQVNWLSKPFSVHQTSEGTALTSSFIFELGAFTSGFTPSASNTSEWAANWKVADRSPFNATNQVFGGTHTLQSNATPFATTERGYIWGYSTSGPNEWILISDASWRWPDASLSIAFPLEWTVGSATDIVVGEVDPAESAFFLRTARILNGSSPRLTGDQWQVANFSPAQLADVTISGWEQDPDGDGLTNLVEMGLGRDPSVADYQNLPIVKVVRVGGSNYLQLEVTKAPAVTMTYAAEVTTDFKNWIGGPVVFETLVNTPNRLVVRDKTAITFLNRRFLRLTVSLED